MTGYKQIAAMQLEKLTFWLGSVGHSDERPLSGIGIQ